MPDPSPGQRFLAYDVILTAVGKRKIEVIKVIREVTGMDLITAKDLVDAAAPHLIKPGARQDEAERVKRQFEAAGATVDLRMNA